MRRVLKSWSEHFESIILELSERHWTISAILFQAIIIYWMGWDSYATLVIKKLEEKLVLAMFVCPEFYQTETIIIETQSLFVVADLQLTATYMDTFR